MDTSYPGGKGGSGVYQTLINLMPQHDTYIETHLGGGALMRRKRPARVNIGIDIDPLVITAWLARDDTDVDVDDARGPLDPPSLDPAHELASLPPAIPAAAQLGLCLINSDAVAYLKSRSFGGNELVYCDPPYLKSTRKKTDIYRYEYTTRDHERLLACIQTIPCNVMISGYASALYEAELNDWNVVEYQAMTRAGKMATELVWFNFDRAQDTATVTSDHASSIAASTSAVMTPAMLAEIGEGLHGKRWRAPLGRDLNVRRETVSRWANGREPIPRDKALAIVALERRPARLHDLQFVGQDYRERERIKRKASRMLRRLKTLPEDERQALIDAIYSTWPPAPSA